jgi:hypothetical protein
VTIWTGGNGSPLLSRSGTHCGRYPMYMPQMRQRPIAIQEIPTRWQDWLAEKNWTPKVLRSKRDALSYHLEIYKAGIRAAIND